MNKSSCLKKRMSSRSSHVLKPFALWGVVLLNTLVFIIAGCSTDTAKEDLSLINGRLEQLENKIAQMEGQLTETKESLTTLSSYVISLEERVNTISQRLQKRAAVPKKTVPQVGTQYHTIVKGDTLYSISNKYGLSVDEIRRLNNLKPDQPIKAGQKLLVAPSGN